MLLSIVSKLFLLLIIGILGFCVILVGIGTIALLLSIASAFIDHFKNRKDK